MRAIAPYKADKLRYTKKANAIYVIYLCPEGSTLPAVVRFPCATMIKAVRLLDTGETCAFTRDNDKLSITLPSAKVGTDPLAQVFVLD
jgi:hypothetical protein